VAIGGDGGRAGFVEEGRSSFCLVQSGSVVDERRCSSGAFMHGCCDLSWFLWVDVGCGMKRLILQKR